MRHLILSPTACLLVIVCICQAANAQKPSELPTQSAPRPVRVTPTETARAISANGETLQEAWDSALNVDPDLEASRWELSAAQRGLDAARAERMPSLSARASYSVFDNPMTINAPIPPNLPALPAGSTASVTVNQREFFLGGVRATQPLYTFGRISSTIDAAGSDVTAALANEQRTELDVKLQVAAAYVGVLQAKRLLEVADAGVVSLEEHERQVKNQVDEGAGIRANLLAVQVALANALQLQLQMQNLLTVSASAYNRALQRPLENPVNLQDVREPTQEYDLELATQEALGQRPEIGFLSAKVSSLRSLAAAKRAGDRPQIVLNGGFSFIENRFLDNEAYNDVGVFAEWNFWDAGRKRQRASQLRRTAEALRHKRSSLESMITLQVKKAWLDLNSAQQQVSVSQKALESADENLRVSRNRYQEGAGTNTEVLDAQTLRTKAYSNYYSGLYGAVLAEMQLQRSIGVF